MADVFRVGFKPFLPDGVSKESIEGITSELGQISTNDLRTIERDVYPRAETARSSSNSQLSGSVRDPSLAFPPENIGGMPLYPPTNYLAKSSTPDAPPLTPSPAPYPPVSGSQPNMYPPTEKPTVKDTFQQKAPEIRSGALNTKREEAEYYEQLNLNRSAAAIGDPRRFEKEYYSQFVPQREPGQKFEKIAISQERIVLVKDDEPPNVKHVAELLEKAGPPPPPPLIPKEVRKIFIFISILERNTKYLYRRDPRDFLSRTLLSV